MTHPSESNVYPYGTPRPKGSHSGPIAPDLTRSTTFAMDSAATVRDVGANRIPGEYYPRYGHPVGRLFESRVAELEGADGALAFASGMAAFHAVLCGLLQSGDTLVCSRDVYGGLDALLAQDLPRFGIQSRRFDPFEPDSLEQALDDTARLVHVETPTNPTCRIVDVRRIAARAHAQGALLSVDATFVPPPLQRLLDHGADLVVHSATKFLGGHSDVLGGIVSSRHELLGRLEAFRRRTGAILGPDAAWLCVRSLATLELRARTQAATALALARFLEEKRLGQGWPIVRVNYPGLPGHPDHALAAEQMDGYGSMLSFVMRGGLEGAVRVYDRLGRIARAVSLGGVETLASLPVHTSHVALSPAERAAAGIDDGMIRISVGLEPFDVLSADLEQAIRSER